MPRAVFNSTRGTIERYNGSTWTSSVPGVFESHTAAEWTADNPTLAEGEPGFETDTGALKIGDGVTAWNSLAYFASGGSGTVWRDGSGAPSSGLGIDGDYYLDDDTGDVYFKATGSYSIVANIKGADGLDGSNGLDGSDGADGTNGSDGADGASAYDVAVANGFIGDEAAWLASLVGAPGADGADGADGMNGADGADGADGAPGPNTVTAATTTDLTGILKGNGANVGTAAAGTDYVAPNAAIVGATKTKVTYDAKGLVTSGANATTADIADSSNKRYVTDAQQTVIGNTSGTNTGDQDLSGLVPTTRTVNGHALSGNVTVTASDVGAVATNAGITGATKTKITYDAKGLVTAGADATTADIADSSNKRYVTDAQQTVIGNTSGTNSGNETTTTVGALIDGATSKATPVDADYLGLMDSAASNILKKLSWANLKATLKTYFDGLYPSGSGTSTGTNTGDQTSVSGNAGTATKLATPRNINGVPFDGSAAITSYIFVAQSSGAGTTAANTTPVDVPGLVWSYAANSIYIFRFIGGLTSTANTTGCGFQLNVSSAITNIWMSFVHQLANTGTLSGGSSNADDASLGVSSGTPTNATSTPVSGWGVLVTGATTGTAQLRIRSETTAVTSADAGMLLVVEKVA